jgi:hypothetical protein
LSMRPLMIRESVDANDAVKKPEKRTVKSMKRMHVQIKNL